MLKTLKYIGTILVGIVSLPLIPVAFFVLGIGLMLHQAGEGVIESIRDLKRAKFQSWQK